MSGIFLIVPCVYLGTIITVKVSKKVQEKRILHKIKKAKRHLEYDALSKSERASTMKEIRSLQLRVRPEKLIRSKSVSPLWQEIHNTTVK